jgi:imidazolonepropionase-like amidohydrolase
MAENIGRAYRAGVKVAGGSDAGTPFNYHENYAYEVELMHTLLGMTPHQALHSATAVAGELVGAGTGRLREGDAADAVLLDRDIASDIRALKAPRAVIKRGTVVFA